VCAASVDLLKRILKLAFGYTQVLVVYSGRRGAHVHVFDEGAMSLSNEGRSAIVSYINGTTGTDKLRSTSGVHLVMKMHNLRKHVYRLFKLWFVDRMGILDSLDDRNTFLNRLDLYKYDSLTDVMDMLVGDVMDKEHAVHAWECIVQKLEGVRDRVPWVLDRLDCAVLFYVWPVLDTNVTRDTAHLTKVPFACHAKTGRVACAVNVDLPASFQPNEDAPTLVSWNQGNMDEALSHFHSVGVSDYVADERHRAHQESGTVPNTHAITDQVMLDLERKAAEALCDVEDLVEAPPPSPPQPKSTIPRKMTFKRKKSPLVPEGGELAPPGAARDS
jgi:DNA primase catalytic subunit